MNNTITAAPVLVIVDSTAESKNELIYSGYIERMRKASDKLGWPHMLGFMDRYNLQGLRYGTEYQAKEYCEQERL